jgi:hypothetical protein
MRAALGACVTRLSATFRRTLVYQPASRYWPFQWAEPGVFALALALAACSAWWIRHRLA